MLYSMAAGGTLTRIACAAAGVLFLSGPVDKGPDLAVALTPVTNVTLLRTALSTDFRHVPPDRRQSIRFKYASIPVDEAGRGGLLVAYVFGPTMCGSGGCPLRIYRKAAGKLVEIGSLSITNFPISSAGTGRNGYPRLVVVVRGGGVMLPYRAALEFDGVRYPGNPTVPPAYPFRSGARVMPLIVEASAAYPLF